MNDTGGRNRSMHRVLHLLSVYSFFPSTSLQKRQPAFGPHAQCPLGLITFPLSSLLFISYLFFVLPALSGSSQSYLRNATKIISFLQPSCSPVSWGCCCCCTVFAITVTWTAHLLKHSLNPQGPRGRQSIDPWTSWGPAVQEASWWGLMHSSQSTNIQAIDCELGWAKTHSEKYIKDY